MNAESQPAEPRFRILRRFVFAAIILLTLIVFFYAEERFRGKHAWERYRKSAETRGVQLDFAAAIPPAIPDEQNAAITPLVQSWLPKLSPKATNLWPPFVSSAGLRVQVPKGRRSNNQDDRRMTDFVSWQQAFADEQAGRKKMDRSEVAEAEPTAEEQLAAAREILSALKMYEAPLNELRIASKKPLVRYPVEYKLEDPFTILLPHLAQIKGIVQELKLQASAELVLGQTDRAFDDVRLILWLADSLENDSFLIGQLVRIAAQQIGTQPIWEGMVEHKWSDAQLKEIQERMRRVNFAQAMSYGMNIERAGGVAVIQTTIKRNNFGEMLSNLETTLESSTPNSIPSGTRITSWSMPRGWLYFEMVNFNRIMDGLIADGWEPASKIFFPQKIEANVKDFETHLQSGVPPILRHQMFARMLLPALSNSSKRFARAQSTANQVILAAALERYYQKHHVYPEALTVLVPEYLADVPNEVVSTTAMRYLRTNDGYVLYSVGWDGVDDGGALLNQTSGKPEKGDWVWRMGR